MLPVQQTAGPDSRAGCILHGPGHIGTGPGRLPGCLHVRIYCAFSCNLVAEQGDLFLV